MTIPANPVLESQTGCVPTVPCTGTQGGPYSLVSSTNPLPVTLATELSASTDSVSVGASASGGATPGRVVSLATTNVNNLKASAGTLYKLDAFNVSTSAVAWLHVYDKVTPVPGTDTPKWSIPLPAGSSSQDPGGVEVAIPAVGIGFVNAVAIAITADLGATTAIAANQVVVNYAIE